MKIIFIFLLLCSCASKDRDYSEAPATTSIVDVQPESTPTPVAAKIKKTKSKSEVPVQMAAANVSPEKESARGLRVVPLPKSTLEIHGDSTLRKYVTYATKLGIHVTVDPPFIKAPEDIIKELVTEFTLVVPVAELKSGTQVLDEHLNKALKSKEFSEIRGTLKSYKIHKLAKGGITKVTAQIELNIAGVKKVVPVEATLSISGHTLQIEGEKELLMTDFDVRPPTLMMGTIKTADAIRIRFNFFLEVEK